ncbi:hypothetical protein [Paraburkholderia phosphatilytica]|uniref:hypothetical protein n=1 Tax=Paraburkholderia phosphatilytica TaxID=2282883 RepID=UPI000E4E0A07|nr:hypothetical protein [Paraburkholderia phosphatilytica]
MKRLIQRLIYALAFVSASVIGGWWLGRLLSPISFGMPLWLDIMIEAGMHLAGATDPLDPEDIELIGLFILFLAYCIIVGVVLAVALRTLRRYIKKRRTP